MNNTKREEFVITILGQKFDFKNPGKRTMMILVLIFLFIITLIGLIIFGMHYLNIKIDVNTSAVVKTISGTTFLVWIRKLVRKYTGGNSP